MIKRERAFILKHTLEANFMILGAIIILAIALVAALIIFAVVLYHQMLMLNEVNKRLLLITQESLERERITKEEQQDALIQLAIATEANVSRESPNSSEISNDESEVNFFSDTNF